MNIVDFMSGAVFFGFLIAGIFFLRFWKRTRDRLFLAFALAFWLMAANQFGYSVMDMENENSGYLYLLRVIGYGLILAAIIGKNIAPKRAD
jgi:predicted permease